MGGACFVIHLVLIHPPFFVILVGSLRAHILSSKHHASASATELPQMVVGELGTIAATGEQLLFVLREGSHRHGCRRT